MHFSVCPTRQYRVLCAPTYLLRKHLLQLLQLIGWSQPKESFISVRLVSDGWSNYKQAFESASGFHSTHGVTHCGQKRISITSTYIFRLFQTIDIRVMHSDTSHRAHAQLITPHRPSFFKEVATQNDNIFLTKLRTTTERNARAKAAPNAVHSTGGSKTPRKLPGQCQAR